MTDFTHVTAKALETELDAGSVTLIDVRTPAEFREGHIPGAKNIPMDQLSDADIDGASRPVVLTCRSGQRAGAVCNRLGAEGRVRLLDGGTQAWIDAGRNVEGSGGSTISLDRQVRITAGALVLLGAAIGALVHPLGYALSAFIGAGLFYSGLSDTCAMGVALGKMPWNR